MQLTPRNLEKWRKRTNQVSIVCFKRGQCCNFRNYPCERGMCSRQASLSPDAHQHTWSSQKDCMSGKKVSFRGSYGSIIHSGHSSSYAHTHTKHHWIVYWVTSPLDLLQHSCHLPVSGVHNISFLLPLIFFSGGCQWGYNIKPQAAK